MKNVIQFIKKPFIWLCSVVWATCLFVWYLAINLIASILSIIYKK